MGWGTRGGWRVDGENLNMAWTTCHSLTTGGLKTRKPAIFRGVARFVSLGGLHSGSDDCKRPSLKLSEVLLFPLDPSRQRQDLPVSSRVLLFRYSK